MGFRRRARPSVSAALVLVLLAFHGWLLWTRASTGHLLDPAQAVRWAFGGVLLAALLVLRRLGVPLLWGRKALVFWLVVFAFHCAAVATPPELGRAADEGGGTQWLFVLPATVLPTALLLVFLWTSAVAHRRARTAPALPVSGLAGPAPRTALAASVLLLLSPRPPPA
jgi:hypothetical protein